MKFEHTEVWGFEHAIRGMRNPLESWDKSDSGHICLMPDWNKRIEDIEICDHCENPNCRGYGKFVIGKNDLNLMQRLANAGSEHRKYLRQIFVSVDITAPEYFFSQFDTYKIGTVANSTSKMHKLSVTPITLDCFETDDYEELTFYMSDQSEVTDVGRACGYKAHWHLETQRDNLIEWLEDLRLTYIQTKDKKYWKELIRWLPESWLQTRTVTMNYENILNICRQRNGHKLNEWEQFVNWAHTLPYAQYLLFFDEKDKEN